jgi:hypothetical protein
MSPRIGLGISSLLVLGFAVHLVYDYAVNGPRARAALRVLTEQFARLNPPPQATRQECHESSKPGQALIGCTYKSALSASQLAEYYDGAFKGIHWAPCDITPVLASPSTHFRGYCEGEFRASLQSGDGGSDWDYGLDLTWHAK